MFSQAYSPGSAIDADDAIESDDAGQVTHINRAELRSAPTARARCRLLAFIAELRRRRVCRAATIYVVTLWLIAQVIDVVSDGFGLPPWTIKAILIPGLAGFPIALVLSWLFDITPEGQVRAGAVHDAPSRKPVEQVIDCSLLLVAVVIGSQLAFAALRPAAAEAAWPVERVSVETFRAASGDGADVFSIGLATEIQHRLVSRPHTKVVSGDVVASRKDWCRIGGTVAIDESRIRVAVTLIDGESGTILWSRIFERERTGLLSDQRTLAEEILQDLPTDIAAVAQS